MKTLGSMRLILGLVVVAVLGSTLPSMAKNSPYGCPGTFDVTSNILGTANPPDQLLSDGVGVYTNENSAIGALVLQSCGGCSTGTQLGLYYVNFSATVTKP